MQHVQCCPCRAKYTAAAEELLQLLTTQQASQQAANARANELVEVLLTCEGLPFQEQLLGPGPWLVRLLHCTCLTAAMHGCHGMTPCRTCVLSGRMHGS